MILIGKALIDLMTKETELAPSLKNKVLCRHPFQESKRAYVSPASIKALLNLCFSNGKVRHFIPNPEITKKFLPVIVSLFQIVIPLPSLASTKQFVQEELSTLRIDHKRYLNPTPYKVLIFSSDNRFKIKFINCSIVGFAGGRNGCVVSLSAQPVVTKCSNWRTVVEPDFCSKVTSIPPSSSINFVFLFQIPQFFRYMLKICRRK